MPLRRARKHESPWQCGSVAEYLAVHKIAYAYQAAHKSYSHSETVESPQRIAAGHKTAVKQHGYYYADSPSMARKTALPCGENLKGMLRIIIPLIKEHMAETRAHHSGHSHIYQQRAHPAFRRTLALVHARHHIESKPEADGEHKSVPAHSHRPGDNLGIHIPYYIIKHNVMIYLCPWQNTRMWRGAHAR